MGHFRFPKIFKNYLYLAMMFSGSQSYYDQHRHTKGIDNIIREQSPSLKQNLLTDRGAYLNYLEVQLERVASACLSVQAYDDRFNDMQSLIVSLDQKVRTLNKMAVLSQEHNVSRFSMNLFVSPLFIISFL